MPSLGLCAAVARFCVTLGESVKASGTLNVDFSRDTNLDVRRLRQGERVTVAGVTGRELNFFTAHNVVLENVAASPPTSAPVAKEDCFRDGWRRFTTPVFKSQGDCVSHVNARDKSKK